MLRTRHYKFCVPYYYLQKKLLLIITILFVIPVSGQEKQKNNRLWWQAIAAIFIGAIFSLSFVFTSESNIVAPVIVDITTYLQKRVSSVYLTQISNTLVIDQYCRIYEILHYPWSRKSKYTQF